MSRSVDIAIFSASYGFGHIQAARAIEDALTVKHPDLRVEVVDYLTLIPPSIAHGTLYVHQFLAHWWPTGYGWMYQITTHLSRIPAWRRIEERPGLIGLGQYIDQHQPRILIATHPMPLMGISRIKAMDPTRFDASIAIITDYVVHNEWIQPGIDHYCVPTEDVQAVLAHQGIDPCAIHVTGLPLRPQFATPVSSQSTTTEPQVLFIAGSQGMSPKRARNIIHRLLHLSTPLKLIFVTGRDARLYHALQQSIHHPRLFVLPYQDDIHSLMRSCDAIITKAGALTVTEVLSMGRPLIIFQPLPGQEEGNAAWLVRRHLAQVTHRPVELSSAVQAVLRQPDLASQLWPLTRRWIPPQASQQIAHLAYNLMTHNL